jgi:hypothetical protein
MGSLANPYLRCGLPNPGWITLFCTHCGAGLWVPATTKEFECQFCHLNSTAIPDIKEWLNLEDGGRDAGTD